MYLHAAQIRLQVVVTETASGDRRVVAYPTDVAYEDDIVYAVTQAIETFGHIDIVVYAAGTDVPEPIAGISSSDWDYVLDVNLRAPFLVPKAVFPYMSQVKRGTIINVSSVAGKRGWANAGAYCAAKFGLTGFTQALKTSGKGLWDSGLCAQSRRHGNPLGCMVPTQRGIGTRASTRLESVASGTGGVASCLDRNCAS